MKEADFLQELDTRLDENARLSKGGLPEPTRWVGSIVGLHPWQTLAFGSLMISVGLWWVLRENIVVLVERVLLIS